MRAVLIREHGEPDSMSIEQVPAPLPGADDILLRIHAAGVNYPDLLVISGRYQILPPLPFSPGKDAAGVVLAVGSNVRDAGGGNGALCVGDRVVAQLEYGGYAEQVAVRAVHAYRIPDSMSFVDAAAMGLAYQTAYFALIDRGGWRPGETVLVNGAGGGVGLAAIQIAKALGATVLAGVRKPHHREIALRYGADHVIDLSVQGTAALRDTLREQVHAVTAGRGVDVILDPLGDDVFDAGIRALAWCGRLVVIGFAAGRIAQLKTNYLLLKNIAVSGLQWSDYRDREPQRVRAVQEILFRMYEEGKIRPHVMQTFALEDYAPALSLVKNGRVSGKVVLTTSPAVDERA